jgi:hypothetical protein
MTSADIFPQEGGGSCGIFSNIYLLHPSSCTLTNVQTYPSLSSILLVTIITKTNKKGVEESTLIRKVPDFVFKIRTHILRIS